MFEELYGLRDVGEFSLHLKTLATANHGKAAREFIKRILKKRAEDPQKLLDFLNAREKGYKKEARTSIGTSEELVRIHDKFATVYVAGCLAIRERILPFKGKDLLEAILTCEADHVRYIREELGGSVHPQRSSVEILSAHIQKNLHTFVDLNKQKLPPNHNHKCCPGYIINRPNGHPAYLFSEEKLQTANYEEPGSCLRAEAEIVRARAYFESRGGKREVPIFHQTNDRWE